MKEKDKTQVGNVKLYFFFQAEDGIRDIGVTGVQTCALPISYLANDRAKGIGVREPVGGERAHRHRQGLGARVAADPGDRSEERRVGKECRSRWSPYH